jgi:two-component system NtrC family sensor kinase
VQSEKLAALGQLVAGVAHEINNPLAFVTNNLVVLQRDVAALRKLIEKYRAAQPFIAAASPAAAAELAELADRIDVPYTLENLPRMLDRSREGLKRIQHIVGDLREFSRQESVGDVEDAVDLNAGVSSTVNIVRGRARVRSVELETDLAPLPRVRCRAPKINQVVLNLIANAIDACAEHGKVTVRTRATPAGWVEVAVSDSGCGIDPAVRDKIFDPFFTTKPQGQGTGLGLSISHGIVADHGGRISVDSAPGRGSTFVIHLPVGGSQRQPCQQQQGNPPAGAG